MLEEAIDGPFPCEKSVHPVGQGRAVFASEMFDLEGCSGV